jgi:choline dehydrogenase-like flavoprotein
VRGNPLDYDTWAQFGNRGWSYEAVLPYFKKSEHYEPGGDDTRGRGGPLNVAALRERAELADVFIEAAVAEGFPRNPDYNNGHQKGFGYSDPQAAARAAGRIPIFSALIEESGSQWTPRWRGMDSNFQFR